MKLSKEMEIWVKAEKLRLKGCLACVRHYEKQKIDLERSIKLEREQAAIIARSIQNALALWKNAPEVKK